MCSIKLEYTYKNTENHEANFIIITNRPGVRCIHRYLSFIQYTFVSHRLKRWMTVCDQFRVEYMWLPSNGNTLICYQPQANRHMLSAYAKYTRCKMETIAKIPADIHAIAYVVGGVKKGKNWCEHRKKSIQIYGKDGIERAFGLLVCESTNLNKWLTCKGNNI